jgi:hypothetical protein
MVLAQIFAVCFILFAWSRGILRFKNGQLSVRALVFWGVLWSSAILFLFWPGQFEAFSKLLGIGRSVDAVIYASILVLFYLVFRAYVQMEELQNEITRLTRALALKDLKKK